jgi:nucleotide-binding universal stress UspA family protein
MDLRPSTRGAMHFGQWLAASSQRDAGGAERIIGVHVLEREQLAPLFRFQAPKRVIEKTYEAVRKSLDSAGALDLLDDIEVELDPDGSDRLCRKVEEHQADAVIVGREQKDSSAATVRLGPTAHRLLRAGRAPVVVVPPNLTPIADPGPVILATDFEDGSIAAAKFARRVAEAHGCTLRCCHVMADYAIFMAAHVPPGDIDEVVADCRREAEARFGPWCESAGIDPQQVELETLAGDPVDGISDCAIAARTPMIVVGSQGKSALERFVVGSVALELATNAPCAVAVVPPR